MRKQHGFLIGQFKQNEARQHVDGKPSCRSKLRPTHSVHQHSNAEFILFVGRFERSDTRQHFKVNQVTEVNFNPLIRYINTLMQR